MLEKLLQRKLAKLDNAKLKNTIESLLDTFLEAGKVAKEISELEEAKVYIIKGDKKSLYSELLKVYNHLEIQLILKNNPDWKSKAGIAGAKLTLP